MNPNLTQNDLDNVLSFFNQMDADMKEARDMIRTEENLVKAVEEYEKAWKVKLKLNYATPKAH